MPLQFQHFQEQKYKKIEGETSEGNKLNNESTNNLFQISPLNLEIKFDLPTFTSEVNDEKLDHWINQIDVYCRIQHIVKDVDKIQLETLKMSSTTLFWWEIHLQSEKNHLRLIFLLGVIFYKFLEINFIHWATVKKKLWNGKVSIKEKEKVCKNTLQSSGKEIQCLIFLLIPKILFLSILVLFIIV